jgi:acetyl esterase
VPLDPVTARINELVLAARETAPPPSVETMRTGWAQLIAATTRTARECAIETIDVGGLSAQLYTPPVDDGGLLVWFHGGGWVIGGATVMVDEVDRLCAQAHCKGISVEYRLAPEHPFPASQLDAVAATTWCVAHAHELGVDPSTIAVGGDSAGGNLAAVAAQRVAGLAAQVLVYPGCNLTEASRKSMRHTEGYLLDGDAIDFFMECATDGSDLADSLLSPQLATDDVLASVPPVLIITAEYDPLRDEGARYAATLREAGVSVQEAHFDAQMHGFFNMPEAIEDARVAIGVAAAFLASRFAA